MAIDLTKLKALELPSKEIQIEVLGEPQTVKIKAYTDDISLCIGNIEDRNPNSSDLLIWKMLLEKCADFSPEDADLYLALDLNGASGLVREIYALTAEFRKKRAEKRAEAKKKYLPAVG